MTETMSREELIDALGDALWKTSKSGPSKQAEAALAVLNPLLKRVGASLEPVSRYVAVVDARPGWRPNDASALAALTDEITHEGGSVFQVVTHGDLRQAASAHTELKGLLND